MSFYIVLCIVIVVVGILYKTITTRWGRQMIAGYVQKYPWILNTILDLRIWWRKTNQHVSNMTVLPTTNDNSTDPSCVYCDPYFSNVYITFKNDNDSDGNDDDSDSDDDDDAIEIHLQHHAERTPAHNKTNYYVVGTTIDPSFIHKYMNTHHPNHEVAKKPVKDLKYDLCCCVKTSGKPMETINLSHNHIISFTPTSYVVTQHKNDDDNNKKVKMVDNVNKQD